MPFDVFPDVLFHFRFEYHFLYRLYYHVDELQDFIHLSDNKEHGFVWHLFPNISGWDIIA